MLDLFCKTLVWNCAIRLPFAPVFVRPSRLGTPETGFYAVLHVDMAMVSNFLVFLNRLCRSFNNDSLRVVARSGAMYCMECKGKCARECHIIKVYAECFLIPQQALVRCHDHVPYEKGPPSQPCGHMKHANGAATSPHARPPAARRCMHTVLEAKVC